MSQLVVGGCTYGVQSIKKAALKLMRKLSKMTGLTPKTIVTDKWGATLRRFAISA